MALGGGLGAPRQLACTNFTTRDCYALNSSTTTKLSFHLALPAVLPTKPALEHFAEWMRATFASGSAPLSPLLDVSVYGARGNMRLPLNRKPFRPGSAVDKPWLRPVSRVGNIEFAETHDDASPEGHHAFTLSLLEQHMWTTGSHGSLRLEERLREWKSGVCARIPARDADDDRHRSEGDGRG